MRVHITNVYGLSGTAAKAQQAVVNIARRMLHCNELGIYHYQVESDTPELLHKRLSGIMAPVDFRDIVIFQVPTWNGIKFDLALFEQFKNYRCRSIIFVHDVTPLMFEENRYLLGQYIELYNQADVLIVPSQSMAEFLCSKGLNVKRVVVQKMWDYKVSLGEKARPPFKKLIHFAGNPNAESKFGFVKKWNYVNVPLSVTTDDGEWAEERNIRFLGWYNDDNLLVNALRKSGGVGLLWSEDSYWCEYMKMNACYKMSTYLAAGLPIIVPRGIAEQNTVVRKGLGFVVESLDEAVERVEGMDKKEYENMTKNVEDFSKLLRNGYFTKKVLLDAMFEIFDV